METIVWQEIRNTYDNFLFSYCRREPVDYRQILKNHVASLILSFLLSTLLKVDKRRGGEMKSRTIGLKFNITNLKDFFFSFFWLDDVRELAALSRQGRQGFIRGTKRNGF